MLIKYSLSLSLLLPLLIYASTKPDTFHVERGVTIKAPPEKIFPLINDFHAWNDWTPYNKDPAMKKIYGAATMGKGATYAWEGNQEVGKGEIAITDTAPPGKVGLELHMIEPFEGRNRVVFTLTHQGDATQVTWAMDGKNSFPGKLIGLFMNMDKMIGSDFDKGLENLKAVTEK
ncbi:MAG: SRPBCC family protein [Nitrosomonadales bacterium]|nr:SRPBCC family protein [Nitrosomonadales bacterium]